MPKTRRTDVKGQATTETVLMLSFLSLLIFGFVHLSLFAVTRHMVDFAAFAAARTVMVGDPGSSVSEWEVAVMLREWPEVRVPPFYDPSLRAGWPAAWQVIDNIRWWRRPGRNVPDLLGRDVQGARVGLTVTYRVPFGMPIFNAIPQGGMRVVGFAPFVVQPRVAGGGDNDEER